MPEEASELELQPIEPDGRASIRRVTKEKYLRPLKHYAPLVQRSDRVLKGWIAAGRYSDIKRKILREPPDFPPFDDLPQLEAWWVRIMTNTCPEPLKALARGDTPPPASAPDPAKETTPGTPPGTPGTAPGATPPVDTGLTIPEFHDNGSVDTDADLGIQYIRGMVQAGIQEMNAANKVGNAKRYWNARKQWEKDVETLRKWETAIVKIQEGKGDVVRTKVMNQVLVAIFSVMGQSFTNALFAITRQLSPALSSVQVREIVLPHRDRVIGHIKKTRFATAWEEAKCELLPPAA